MNPVAIAEFEELTEVKADAKNRISLGRQVKAPAKYYKMYQEPATGRILLEPLAVVPFSEPWLKKSPKAKKSVERGLAQAKAGRLIKAKEDFSKYLAN